MSVRSADWAEISGSSPAASILCGLFAQKTRTLAKGGQQYGYRMIPRQR